MRKARVKFHDLSGYFHCMSRIINHEFLLDDACRDQFVKIMRKVEALTGTEVITFVVMSNHFHILLAENIRQELNDEQLLDRLRAYYGKTSKTYLEHDAWLKQLRADGLDAAAAEFHERFQARMNDVSEFMKTLKQCFTQWYNEKNRRSGTIWDGRFKSVMVEPMVERMSESRSGMLSTVAAYIDLNPVRARMVTDPAKYRWSGYAAALGGCGSARAGLERLYTSDGTLALGFGKDGEATWDVVCERYRMLVYERGVRKTDRSGKIIREGFGAEEIRAELERGGKLPLHDLLLCRVRYFSEGVMIGSAHYIDSYEEKIREKLGLKRARLAKAVRECADSSLYAFRRFWKQQVLIDPD